MTENNNHSDNSSPYNSNIDRRNISLIGIREKLIIIFLLVKVIPLILLACIAWRSLVQLGDVLRLTSVTDSREALTARSVENIERISTDTAQKVAEFLYSRDADINFLAKGIALCNFTSTEDQKRYTQFFADFCDSKTQRIRKPKRWELSQDGMSWVSPDRKVLRDERGTNRSVNVENNDVIDGATFRYRPPFGFGDSRENFTTIPLYDEVAVIDLNGKQLIKYVPPNSTKKRYPFPKELLNVADPQNTFVKSERYFRELSQLGKDGIYVSDVIGAYTPCRFIGMYTPDNMASQLINAEIAQLEKEPTDKDRTELAWKLRVLNAELRNDEKTFNGKSPVNQKNRGEIDRRLGENATWPIKDKNHEQVALELKALGLTELSQAVADVDSHWHPEQEAYSGAENPLGIRFEGIVRWVKPVLDAETQEVVAYVTFALNHDVLLDMLAHITPMDERFCELSDAWDGNYAFIWDYHCRSIVHPRHHSMVGYNPETGKPETPWLESTLYNDMIKKGYKREDWQDYIAKELPDYVPFAPNPEKNRFTRPDGSEYSTGYTKEDINPDEPDAVQVRVPTKVPAKELTAAGLVALDGRYLNNAPQCTGWVDLVKDGGSGSLYILWSGVYKLNTASCIPYYTGQYNPDTRPRLPDGSKNRIGFGFVAIGAGIDFFSEPANEMGDKLAGMINTNLNHTTMQLIITTVLLSILVIFIAVWMASYLSNRLTWLINGISKFRAGARHFRFASERLDEFGKLADSFDDMADNIVQSVHSPLVILNNNTQIIYANELSLSLFNKTYEEILGKNYSDFSIYPRDTVYCPLTMLQRGNKKGEIFFDEKSKRYWQGEANYFVNEQGQRIGYLIMSNDVHDLQLHQIELEQAKNRAETASRHKTEFLARMSHELRTPMNAIIGMNNVTQQQIDHQNFSGNAELKNNLKKIQDSSSYLLSLLNDVLEMSNLETNSVSINNKPVNLNEILEGLGKNLLLNCEGKRLNGEMKFAKFEPSDFITDGLRLRQILTNLLNNAVKFTPEGGKIEFVVSRKDREEGKTLVSFVVRDTGIGIAPENLDKILTPFEQADTSFTRQFSGSGLGLAIVQYLLKLFGSEIRIKSEPGRGSEFSFELWLLEDKTTETVKTVDVTDKFRGQRALVIDDVAVNRLVLASQLKIAGFKVEEAKDGAEGLAKFAESPQGYYDVVFMDLQMPVMDGFDAARSIRNLERADAVEVPIVAISANAFQEDIAHSLESGMNAHYAKPIKIDSLSAILMEYCKPTQ